MRTPKNYEDKCCMKIKITILLLAIWVAFANKAQANGNSNFLSAEKAFSHNKFSAAISGYKIALANQNPNGHSFFHSYVLLKIAQSYERKGDSGNAINYYKELRDRHPAKEFLPEVQFSIANLLFKEKRYAESLLEIEKEKFFIQDGKLTTQGIRVLKVKSICLMKLGKVLDSVSVARKYGRLTNNPIKNNGLMKKNF